jgi:hypothetical protein
LRALAELLEAPPARAKTEWLARALERAASAVADWDERVAEEGGGAVWLLLRNADPLESASAWLLELAPMHVAWCHRLGLVSEIVAVGFTEDALARVAIEVEGPGAATYMAMEQGVHRLHRERGDLRVRVDLIPRGDPRPGEAPRTVATRRRVSSPLGVETAHVGRVDHGELGLLIELGGPARDTLEALLGDLDSAAPALAGPLETARVYAQGGTGARDPRTGSVVPRFKDALRGGLDPLLEAWRRARRHAATGA